MSIKITKLISGPNIQTENSEESGKLLLLTDFAGKIVFWKGDWKVMEASTGEYLHKNFLSFDFTLYSRLMLASRLTYDIFIQGHRQSFQLELLRKTSGFKLKHESSKPKKIVRKSRKDLIHEIKFLKATVSCIHVGFHQARNIGKNLCEFQCMPIHRKWENIKSSEDYDKFLMFEIEDNNNFKDQNHLIYGLTQSQIEQKFADIEYSRKNKTNIFHEPKNPFQSAFSYYTFNEDRFISPNIRARKQSIALKQKEQKMFDESILNAFQKQEGYNTRSKRIQKCQQSEKNHPEENIEPRFEEADIFNMVEEK